MLILISIIFRYIFQFDSSSLTIQFIKSIIEHKRDYRNESVLHFEGDRKV